MVWVIVWRRCLWILNLHMKYWENLGKKERKLLVTADCNHCVCIHLSQPDTHTHSQHDFGMWLLAADEARFMAPSCIAACGSKSGQRNFLVPVITKTLYSTVPAELFTCIITSTTEERECYISIMKRDGFASDIHLTKNIIMQLQIHVTRHWHKRTKRQINYRSPQQGTKTDELSRHMLLGRQEWKPEGRMLNRAVHR